MQQQDNIKQVILSYISNGLCALPANSAQKRPVVNWKQYQDRKPTASEIEYMFNTYSNIDAIAVICGAVSGGLEVIDFDWGGKSLEDWGEQMVSLNMDYSSFPIEQTQSGGFHIFYRTTGDVQKNTKLTWVNFGEDELEDVNGDKYYHGKKVLKGKDSTYGGCTIETRGEGGLIICAPSKGYSLIKGSWLEIPVISNKEVDIVKRAATNLSTATLEPPKREVTYSLPAVVNPSTFSSADYLRGTNASAEILARNGWTFVGLYNGDGDCELWRRPGKSTGISALRHASDGRVHIWTTSTELEGGRMYSPLQLLAALEYGGDERTASRVVFDEVAPHTISESFSSSPDYLNFTYESLLAGNKKVKAVTVVEKVEEEEDINEWKKSTLRKTSARGFLNSYPKLPESIRNLSKDSFMWHFVDSCYNASGIKQDELYFASAMATLSHIVGDKVHYGALYPNIYCICTAKSGCGKNTPLQHARDVAEFYDHNSSTNGFQSEQVMGDMFLRKSKLLWIQDEYGQWLDRAYNKGKTISTQYDVLRLATDIWSKAGKDIKTGASRKNKELSKDKTAGNDGCNEMTYKPWLSILCFSTPESLQNFINTSSEDCGTLARFFFPFGNTTPEKKFVKFGDTGPDAVEKAVCQEWRDLGVVRSKSETYDDFSDYDDKSVDFNDSALQYLPSGGYDMSMTKEAEEMYLDVWSKNEKRAEKARVHEGNEITIKGYLVRHSEYIIKYAMLFACDKYGANLDKIVIDCDCLKLAIDYWNYSVECIKYLHSFMSGCKSQVEADIEKKINRIKTKITQRSGKVKWELKDFTYLFRNKHDRDSVIQDLIDLEILEQLPVEVSVGKGATRVKPTFNIDCDKLFS